MVLSLTVFETAIQNLAVDNTLMVTCPPVDGAAHIFEIGRAVIMQALPSSAGFMPRPNDCINSAITNRVSQRSVRSSSFQSTHCAYVNVAHCDLSTACRCLTLAIGKKRASTRCSLMTSA